MTDDICVFQKVPRELYGPTMIVFTLIAILLYQMKTSGHTVVSKLLSFFLVWSGTHSLRMPVLRPASQAQRQGCD